MKVVAFLGSPRDEGNTSIILKEILRGAIENEAEIKFYNLYDLNLKACRSCCYCRVVEKCSTNDDMDKVLEEIKNADAVIIGSAIFMGQVTGPVKNFIDRLFPLLDNDFKPRYGTKNTIMVYSLGLESGNTYKDYFMHTAKGIEKLGLKVTDSIIYFSGNELNSAKENQIIKAKAYNIGRKLVENYFIKKDIENSEYVVKNIASYLN
jgi:multimeric flavodoxin WrbA